MKKKTFMMIIGLILIESGFIFLAYKSFNNKILSLDEVGTIKEKDSIKKSNSFAIMLEQTKGKQDYEESSMTSWPGEGYKFNSEKSGCMDKNGVELDKGILQFNDKTHEATVTTNTLTYCYLYFDIKPPGSAGTDILDSLPASSGLSTSKLGDMRRYQGTSAKNYICINDTGAKCNSGSNEMYRIIGIVTDGDEEGQIKVIKETKYGNTYAWNNNYQSSQCSGTTCSWPNNDLAKTLNTTFLQSLPTKVQNVIVAKQWYYGDLGLDYANKDASQIYQIETGAINTQYYDVATGNQISNQKWQKTSGTSKIGLMYLHDYYWQSTVTNCHYSSSTYSQCKTNGWMHLSQNNNTSDSYEWTMSRIGRHSSSSPSVYAWNVYSNGNVNYDRLYDAYAVRPVFYLSSDVRIKDGGTGEKTNPYILDIE